MGVQVSATVKKTEELEATVARLRKEIKALKNEWKSYRSEWIF